jgi:hypothetical protein
MRKSLIALPVLALVAAGGYFGLDTYAQHEGERQVEEIFLDLAIAGVMADHGTVDFDLPSRRLEVADIKLYAPGTDGVRIGRLAASGLWLSSNGRIRADRIELANVAYDEPGAPAGGIKTTFRASSMVVGDYDGPASPAPSGTAPGPFLLSFLETASATSLAASQVSIETGAGQGRDAFAVRLDLGETRLSGIVNGRVANVEIGLSTLFLEEPGIKSGYFAKNDVARTVIRNIDVAALAFLADPARRDAENAAHTLFESIEAYDSTIMSDGGNVQKLGKMSIGKLAVWPAGLRLEQLVAGFMRKVDLEARGRKLPDDEMAALLTDLISFRDAVDWNGLAIENVTAKGPDQLDLAIRTVRVDQMVGELPAIFAVEGVSGILRTGQPVKAERVAFTGTGAEEAGKPGVEAASGAVAIGDPATALRQLSSVRGVQAHGVVVGSTPDDLLQVDELQLDTSDYLDFMPSKMAVHLRMSAPAALLAASQPPFPVLAALGMPRVALSFDGTFDLDADDRTLAVAPSLAIDGAFSSTLKLNLDDVDPTFFTAAKDVETSGKMLAFRLTGLEFTLEDAGIYQLKLTQLARDGGVQENDIRLPLLQQADSIGGSFVSAKPDLAPARKAIMEFLSNPRGKLAVRITPKGSLPLAALAQARMAGGIPAMLDLVTIEATASR